MPLFKVTAEKPMGCVDANKPFFNPFAIRDIFSDHYPKMQRKVREWVFEAKNKKAVRRLWDEAQEQGIDNVQGFTLMSIEELKPCIHTPDCVEDYCAKGVNPKYPEYRAA